MYEFDGKRRSSNQAECILKGIDEHKNCPKIGSKRKKSNEYNNNHRNETRKKSTQIKKNASPMKWWGKKHSNGLNFEREKKSPNIHSPRCRNIKFFEFISINKMRNKKVTSKRGEKKIQFWHQQQKSQSTDEKEKKNEWIYLCVVVVVVIVFFYSLYNKIQCVRVWVA